MRAQKLDREILQVLSRIKKAHFYDILTEVNKSRRKRMTHRDKGQHPDMKAKSMSPTTLNKRLRFLVETKAVDKQKISHKNITYELRESVGYTEASLIGALTDVFSVFGFTKDMESVREFVEKPFYNLLSIMPKLTDSQLRNLQAALTKSLELLDYYIDNKK
jgi:DNA-binding HxlR family transcriptional regulator